LITIQGVLEVRNDKEYLINRLTETHNEIQKIIERIDLDIQVYDDPKWRVRDIVGHIATWDREMIKTLQAFLDGTEYIIPGIEKNESNFNEIAVLEQRKLSTDQILDEWSLARKDFLAVIQDIPDDRFPGDFIFPWGDERGSIRILLDYFIEHDEEHRDEIINALKSS
jgi:hypothetical protein